MPDSQTEGMHRIWGALSGSGLSPAPAAIDHLMQRLPDLSGVAHVIWAGAVRIDGAASLGKGEEGPRLGWRVT